MTTAILFTSDHENLETDKVTIGSQTVTIDEIRPSLGENAFQIDSVARRSDGAYVIQASLPRYTMHEGRVLNAYSSLVLTELPNSLKEWIDCYKGRSRIIADRTGQPVLDANGCPVKGHLWQTFEGRQFSALQVYTGHVICLVGDPRPSRAGHTIEFKFLMSKDVVFGPWTRPITRPAQELESITFAFPKKVKKVKSSKFDF